MDSIISWAMLCIGAIAAFATLVRALPQPPKNASCKLQGSYKLDF